MAFGGALSYNGVDATLAAGIIGSIPATPFYAIPAGGTCSDEPLEDTGFTFGIPSVDTNFNVLVNGYAMTVRNDMFGELLPFGSEDTNPLCNPSGDFTVPLEATISNVLVNGVNAAVPGIAPNSVAPIISADSMKMQTAQTNVILYW